MNIARLSTALLCGVTQTLAAQEPAPRAVAAPLHVLSKLSDASAVVERDDGTALAVMFEKGELAQLTPATGAFSKLPIRYAFGRAMALDGGRIGVARMDRRDVLVLDAQGRVVDSLATPTPAGVFVIGQNAMVALFDAKGRRYQVGGNRADPEAPLMRYDREQSTTVATLRQKTPGRISIGGGGGTSASASRAFEPVDAWALAPDGRVAVVRGQDYRVVWFTPTGDSVAGPRIPVDARPVTDADKSRYRAEQQASLDNARKMMGGSLGGATMTVPEPTWPASLPAMNGANIMIGTDGTLWVPRHGDASARVNVWDAFDAQGVRRTRVSLPAEWQLIGAGRGRLYAVGTKGLAVFAEP